METQLWLNFANKTAYSRPDVLTYYQNLDVLFETENVLFEKLLPTIKDSKILGLGIGGGRTTKHLLKISNDYTGVDYASKFAEETGRKYPEAKILCCDAGNLKEFDDQAFDFVLFSFNGLDCISNEDRLKALKEVYRVLKVEGIFMFSSHNRDYQYFNKLPWQRKIEFNWRFFKFFLYCLYHLPTHFKMRRNEIYTDNFAVVNDGDHRFSMLVYYISLEKQLEQLSAAGFSDIEAYNCQGKLVEHDTLSHWIYYLARKK